MVLIAAFAMEGGGIKDPDYCLSDSDVKRVAGNTGLLITRYPELQRFATWDDFLANAAHAAAVLFLVQGPTSGHWIAAFDGPDNTAQVWDPLGMPLDSQRGEISANKREQLGEKEPQFARLLATASAAGKRPVVNHVEFQEFSPSINTCGRWVGLRILHRDKTDAEFKAFVMEKVKAAGCSSPDAWVTQYTNPRLVGAGVGGKRRPEDDTPWLDDVSTLMGGRLTGGMRAAAPRVGRPAIMESWGNSIVDVMRKTASDEVANQVFARARAVSHQCEEILRHIIDHPDDEINMRPLVMPYIRVTATPFEEALARVLIRTLSTPEQRTNIENARLRVLQGTPATTVKATAAEREREQEERYKQQLELSDAFAERSSTLEGQMHPMRDRSYFTPEEAATAGTHPAARAQAERNRAAAEPDRPVSPHVAAAASASSEPHGGRMTRAKKAYLRTKLPGDYELVTSAKLPITLYSSEAEHKVVALLPVEIIPQTAAKALQRARRFVRSTPRFEYAVVGTRFQKDLMQQLKDAGLAEDAVIAKPDTVYMSTCVPTSEVRFQLLQFDI